jgi:hypothetical protein
MSRNVRSLVSDLLAIALGLAVASFSTTVLSAARSARVGDNAAPSVWLLSPGNNQAVTGTITVSATASQDTEALQFQLNGGSLGPTVTSGACSMNWNTAAVPDGNYTLTVVGYDASGNATTSSPSTVTVENSIPLISGIVTSGITDTSAVVTWSTNQLSSSSVDYGVNSYTNSTPLDVNLTTQHAATLVGLQPGTTYHFRVSSWNGVGLLATSGDLSFTTAGVNTPGVPAPPSGSPGSPAGCVTPDPFAAFGGGMCVNGGWLPPGAGYFQGQPAAPAPPTIVTGCNTPDPFTAIGGGTCVNGGWLPRNVVTPPAPPAAPVAPVAPTPTVPSGPCGTPDPFAALGGGTCFNGGWFPPGMLPAPGSVAPVAPPPVQSNPTGCITPDPFSGIPGLRGVCVNGGWYPVRAGG